MAIGYHEAAGLSIMTVSQKSFNRRWHAPEHIEMAWADGQLHDFLRCHQL